MVKKNVLKFSFVLALIMIAVGLTGCGAAKSTVAPEKATSGKQSETKIDSKTLNDIKKRGKLVVGVKYDTKLFGLKDPASGKVEGFDIDIAKALAKKILGDENKIELKEVTSKTRIPMLKNGEIDAILATMTITEERKQEVDFSDVYFKAGQSLLVKKGSSIKGLPDIKKGVKVLAVKGCTCVKTIKEKAPDATVLEFENYSDAFSALKAGQGDTLTTDNSILYGMVKQDSSFEVVGGTFTDEPYGIAIAKGDAGFVAYVNDFLKEMKSNGSYDKLYETWIGK